MTRFKKKSVQTFIVALVTALLCLGFIRLANAESLQSTLGSPFVETLHHVSLTRTQDVAHLDVQRAFRNEGLQRDEMILTLSLPDQASMTSIAIFEERWKPAHLKSADHARSQYYETTHPVPRRHNLLAQKYDGALRIRIAPVAPGETLLIRYTIDIEMDYQDGYSFAWKVSPKGTDPFCAVQFQSTHTIWIKGKKRSADEIFNLHANPCEENELDANCVIAEFSLPETRDDHVQFTAEIVGNARQHVVYRLISPEGDAFTIRGLEEERKIILDLPSISGKWLFSITKNADDLFLPEHRVGARHIQLAFDETTLRAKDITYIKSRHDSDRIYFSESREHEGKLSFGSFEYEGHQFSKIDAILPHRLSALPQKALMIFLVDTSISQSDWGLRQQLELVNAITKHTKDEEIKLIAYSRHAEEIQLDETRSFEKERPDLESRIALSAPHPALNPTSPFDAIARACDSAHPGKNYFLTRMETTNNEIVDVNEGKGPYEKCIVEGIWSTRLPREVRSAVYNLQFTGAKGWQVR